MAKATARSIPPVPVKPVLEYTLVLSQAEADALATVLGFVGGAPTTTRRGLIDKISAALFAVGGVTGYPAPDVDRASPGVYFSTPK